MGQFLEYLKMAIDNIISNKGRSFLTMLGIIIGISSVIIIVAIGNGASAEINSELNSMAGGQINIYVGDTGVNGENLISVEDMTAITDKISQAKGITPAGTYDGTVLTQKGDFDGLITYGTEDLQFINEQDMLYGNYFTKEDVDSAHKVCVISQDDAIRLFGTADVIGMTIELTMDNITSDIEIIGVKNMEDSNLVSYSYEGMPVSLEMPYTTMAEILGGDLNSFNSIYVIGKTGVDTKIMADSAVNLLNSRHQIKEDDVFMVQDFTDVLENINSVIGIMSTFVIAVAGISLLVGGIGVMNIMLVSVTERTREIGIRKSLGAKTKSIMLQFLAESAIITLLGGIVGIILGIGGAYAICAIPVLKDISPVLSFSNILVATLFSSGVGLFFGIYPARKAAKMNPIDALRRE